MSAPKQPGCTWNVASTKMYQLYASMCQDEDIEPHKSSMYDQIFREEFNLGFHKPKKDLCHFCTKFANSSFDEKQTLTEQYTEHQKRKKEARDQK